VDWGPYAKVIVEIIRRNWIDRMPPAFEAGLKGRSVLSFRISKNGTVSGIVLNDGSGVRPYDKAAEYAIEASNPLPPLPPAFGALNKEDVGVTFEFYYNLRPPTR
jgi:TonB family protein